jgi:hypothetical protein
MDTAEEGGVGDESLLIDDSGEDEHGRLLALA